MTWRRFGIVVFVLATIAAVSLTGTFFRYGAGARHDQAGLDLLTARLTAADYIITKIERHPFAHLIEVRRLGCTQGLVLTLSPVAGDSEAAIDKLLPNALRLSIGGAERTGFFALSRPDWSVAIGRTEHGDPCRDSAPIRAALTTAE